MKGGPCFHIEDQILIEKGKILGIVGESGAGKSIIIEAVNLLLGSRASADLVRTGEQSAELEACFEIDEDSLPDVPALEPDYDFDMSSGVYTD